jgi:hypothetical protein
MEFDAATQIDTLIKQAKDAGYNSLGDAMNDKVNKLNRGTDAAIAMQAGKASVLSVAAADPTNLDGFCKLIRVDDSVSVQHPVWQADRQPCFRGG